MRRWRFNRRRDACFLATTDSVLFLTRFLTFQSQTRRLLPRNMACHLKECCHLKVSIADATLASSQLSERRRADQKEKRKFQSQTRRLLPRNHRRSIQFVAGGLVSIADATLASSQHQTARKVVTTLQVSIADATLASSQRSW